jgi:ribosomal protein L15
MQKKDISLMSVKELNAYVENVCEKRRQRKYNDEVIKNDEEKYAKFLNKCKKNDKVTHTHTHTHTYIHITA